MQIIKNIKKNSIILILITTIILILLLKDDYQEIIRNLVSMNILCILIAAFFFFLSIFFKALTNYLTINNKKKISIIEAFKHEVIIQFFNGITPFSSGGQPMEIYMMTKHNISIVEATNISIQTFIFYQVALVIYGILAVCYNYFFQIFPNSVLLSKLVLLGFFINSLVAILLFIFVISKTITNKIATFLIKMLSRTKLIKNPDDKIDFLSKKLDEFHQCARLIKQRKGLFTKGVILNLISLTFLYIVPLLIVYSLNDYSSLTPLKTLTTSAYVLLIGSFVPIPGASGGIEFGFLSFYGNFIKKNILYSVLIVWRFITYYLGIIIGAITFCLEKKVK